MRPYSSLAKSQTSNELNGVAVVACVPRHQPDFGVVSANERYDNARRLERIHLDPIVDLSWDVNLVNCFGDATPI